MGAGGQQPLWSHPGVDITLRRSGWPKLSRYKTVLSGGGSLPRERKGPPPGIDSIRMMPQRRRACAGEARLGRKAEQGSVNLDAPASK